MGEGLSDELSYQDLKVRLIVCVNKVIFNPLLAQVEHERKPSASECFCWYS